ncbi:MAG TPA: hypothetical protein VMZ91_05300 [Candidatus Paceibacterota bacterium]|nr:hypothetical protein [Candidatus Paceibacterota bacterium]
MRKFILLTLVALIFISALFITSCDTDASVASWNVSKAADQFEIYRRVVFYNGITDEYILMIEGYCSINVDGVDKQLELTVKTGPGTYVKHFLGLSDNVTYFVEQMEPSAVSDAHYRVIFKPSVIIPTIDVE